jgi:hypothetical protein
MYIKNVTKNNLSNNYHKLTAFLQLIVFIRATMKMLKYNESEGDVVTQQNVISKKGQCIWAVFLRDSLQSIDNMLKTGSQQDRILAKVQHMLQLERVNPGIAWAMQDDELCKIQEVNITWAVLQCEHHYVPRGGSYVCSDNAVAHNKQRDPCRFLLSSLFQIRITAAASCFVTS